MFTFQEIQFFFFAVHVVMLAAVISILISGFVVVMHLVYKEL